MAKKMVILSVVCGMLLFCIDKVVYAEGTDNLLDEYYDSYLSESNLNKIDEELFDITGKYNMQSEISFQEIFGMMMEGQIEKAFSCVMTNFYESMIQEFVANREIVVRILLLVIVASVFNNYSSILKMSFVGEQGFYITYLMIVLLLMQSFSIVYDLGGETVCCIKEVMECMLPAFYLSLIMCSGFTTSHMANTIFISMLTFVQRIMLVGILPAIRIYFLVVLLNQIEEKDRFSKLAGLIKQAIVFLLKAIVAGVVGLNTVKTMLIPVYENVKYNALQKGLSMIPGGASISGLSSILIGAGVLIKNSVGITVVLILLFITAIPILKIFAFYIVYRVLLAVVQPISNKRILASINSMADSTGLLLRTTATSVVLSILSVAIIIMTTNVRLYS